MPRDVHGKPVKPEGSKAAEPVKAGASGDKDNDPRKREAAEAFDKAEQRFQNHHDRLARIEEHLGIAHRAVGFRREDQGGKEKIESGHVTEKGGAMYARKRHS